FCICDFFFSSRRRHTRWPRDWSSDVCSSDLLPLSYFALLRQALERVLGVDNLVVSHLGEVTQPDIVPEIADLLLRLEGKTWSLRSEERRVGKECRAISQAARCEA